MNFASCYSANHAFGPFQKDTTHHSPQPRKATRGETLSSCMAAPGAQWIQECGIHTYTFPAVNGNLCLLLPAALIPLGISLFQTKWCLSCLQAAGWSLGTVQRDRLMENEHCCYSTFWDMGTPCLVIPKIFLLIVSETIFCVHTVTLIYIIIVMWKMKFQYISIN